MAILRLSLVNLLKSCFIGCGRRKMQTGGGAGEGAVRQMGRTKRAVGSSMHSFNLNSHFPTTKYCDTLLQSEERQV